MLHILLLKIFHNIAEKVMKIERQKFVINFDPFFSKDIAVKKIHLRKCGKL